MNLDRLPWDVDGWAEEAHEWILASLEAHGLRLKAAIEQPHIRPWSTVLRVPSDGGILFFKATASILAYEPALTAYLSRLRPDVSPQLLAVDLVRGWMLMRDSGTPLRSYIHLERSLRRWREILPQYAGLQKEMSKRTAEILALGVLDRRLANLPEQFADMVADAGVMLVNQPDGLTAAEYEKLKESVGIFKRLCDELASAGIPESLHHDDFHDGNLFLNAGRVIFTDWGESAVTHPFFSLVVMLRGACNTLDLAPDAPELDEMRGWYLEQWREYGSMKDLRRIAGQAERAGLVNRALTWRRVIANLPEGLKGEYAPAVPGYLQEYLHSENMPSE
jgi:hypothetical protein